MDADRDGAQQFERDMTELPQLLKDAVDGVAAFARGVVDLVGILDDRYGRRWTDSAPDPGLARLVSAARRGPSAAALALGKAARRPAVLALPGTAPPYRSDGDATRAASALLTWAHHEVDDVTARDLLDGADAVPVAALLAAVAVNLAADAVPDVDAWLAEVGADWSVDHE